MKQHNYKNIFLDILHKPKIYIQYILIYKYERIIYTIKNPFAYVNIFDFLLINFHIYNS